jgi:hypothetical protein
MEPAGSMVRRRGSQVDGHFPADNPEKLRFSGTLFSGGVIPPTPPRPRRMIVPEEIGYPTKSDWRSVGPKPSTFAGDRALGFVLENQVCCCGRKGRGGMHGLVMAVRVTRRRVASICAASLHGRGKARGAKYPPTRGHVCVCVHPQGMIDKTLLIDVEVMSVNGRKT